MATSGFEESELTGPKALLEAGGAEVRVAAPSMERIRATVRDEPGIFVQPDVRIAEARADEWDALLLPGGVINPDALRRDAQAVALIRAFVAADKPVAAICHGPWLLIEAGVVRGRRVTGWPSIHTDLVNAGAIVEDANVVRDGLLITATAPEDVAGFTAALADAIEA
jgi:protease I